MAIKETLISTIIFIQNTQTNLDTFISTNGPRITVAALYEEFIDDVRFNAQKDYPDLILIQFSEQGKRLSANALSREELYHAVSQTNRPSVRHIVYCAMMKNCIYMWGNKQQRRSYRRQAKRKCWLKAK